MSQKLIQTQTQKQQQLLRLTAQQMLQVKLLEMPLTELEQSVNAELDDNPALERTDDEEALNNNSAENDNEHNDTAGDEDYEQEHEREEREDALDSALESIGRDDQMPEYNTQKANNNNADYEEMVYGDTTSFYDRLREQMGMQSLTQQQEQIMEYLIGSLDDDGWLRKDLTSIADELAIYHNIDVTKADVELVLHRLQSFDPAGIGARNLQECLLLQIRRKNKSPMRDLMEQVMLRYFDEFTKNHWDKIRTGLELTDRQAQALQEEIRRLNPKPGASLGETEGRNLQQVTPDFIVDTDDSGHVSFYLNQGNLPELTVSSSFTDMVDTYRNNKAGMSRQAKEALLYAKEKVEKARGFIEAVRQRRHTMYVTMKAIIDWQKKFFQDGDESELRPMILKDIATKTGLDISTISRVSNIKYAQTKWGTFPLRFFFTDGYATSEGETMSTRKIKLALKDLVAHEDQRHPLSDDALAAEMKKLGYPIARRTVAKYREQLNIPVARLRKS